MRWPLSRAPSEVRRRRNKRDTLASSRSIHSKQWRLVEQQAEEPAAPLVIRRAGGLPPLRREPAQISFVAESFTGLLQTVLSVDGRPISPPKLAAQHLVASLQLVDSGAGD